MKDDWPETRAEFRRLAAREGVARIAREIPADPKTVYRITSGETVEPCAAIRARIEQLVAERARPKP